MARRAKSLPIIENPLSLRSGEQKNGHIDVKDLLDQYPDDTREGDGSLNSGPSEEISGTLLSMTKTKFNSALKNVALIKKSILTNPDIEQEIIANIMYTLVIPALEAAGPNSALNRALGSDAKLRKLLGLSDVQPPPRRNSSPVGKNFAAAASPQEIVLQKGPRVPWSDVSKKTKADGGLNPVQFILKHYGNKSDNRKTWKPLGLTRSSLRSIDFLLAQAWDKWVTRHPNDKSLVPIAPPLQSKPPKNVAERSREYRKRKLSATQ